MDILKEIGEAAALEQLAEECAELGKAALKMARIIRGENPTPVTMAEARENLLEELIDVCTCIDVCDFRADAKQFDRMFSLKLDRWKQRIREMKDGKKHNES